MEIKRIVITGGPGTGKTTLIKHLESLGYACIEEISRQITLEAQKKGIDQLFLNDPLLFSEKLLQGRIDQFNDVGPTDHDQVFFDRGIPDVVAYMDYIDASYPEHFLKACQSHIYDQVFILAPWQEIYVSDNERYENFDQALIIHKYLMHTYSKFGYELIDVPFGSVGSRTDFILNATNLL